MKMANIFTVMILMIICLLQSGSAQQQQQQQQQQRQHTAVRPSANNACDSQTGLLPHESHCDKYYVCEEGITDVRDCPNGLVFIGRGRGLKEHCGYPWDTDCSSRPNRNHPIASDHCEWKYGIFSHETSCTRYWTCWNGTAIEQFCIGGLLYNEFTHACDWPDNVNGCQKHPLCKDTPDGRVSLGKSCTRFWQCIGGYPRLMRCPATLVFDKISRRCIEPPTEDCDVQPTTANPDELIPSPQGQGVPKPSPLPQQTQLQELDPLPEQRG